MKHGRGRPKGSKNKPSAGNIGRPCKDGQPPQKWQKHSGSTLKIASAWSLSARMKPYITRRKLCAQHPLTLLLLMKLAVLMVHEKKQWSNHNVKMMHRKVMLQSLIFNQAKMVHKLLLTGQHCQVMVDGGETRCEDASMKWPWRHEPNVPSQVIDTDNIYGMDVAAGDHQQHHFSDEFEQSEGKTGGNSVKQSSMLSWLGMHCRVVKEMLKGEIQKSTCNPQYPKCYEAGQFWIGDTSPVLVLLSQSNLIIEPAAFHQPAFFVWLPHCLLGDHIPCLQCKGSGQHDSR
ncbi:hypothetical protein BKA82DRAFT_10464 [Pisolithus tinctorius]|uniref:Uncharacterized protein n=1 Tax=Pisolithus tinctorius Marx 270 TaxID=870435 RepID=A0A0C3JNC1_PISTI|nr:hypothetical protein BKA82DRAFT_10464 [Pisolithus tinctorius]KIN99011.1 hypothetical protein M404DRAFT_10464 [Pisolithus tinctorius Marx 270]